MRSRRCLYFEFSALICRKVKSSNSLSSMKVKYFLSLCIFGSAENLPFEFYDINLFNFFVSKVPFQYFVCNRQFFVHHCLSSRFSFWVGIIILDHIYLILHTLRVVEEAHFGEHRLCFDEFTFNFEDVFQRVKLKQTFFCAFIEF